MGFPAARTFKTGTGDSSTGQKSRPGSLTTKQCAAVFPALPKRHLRDAD